jgi:hypothetical protein
MPCYPAHPVASRAAIMIREFSFASIIMKLKELLEINSSGLIKKEIQNIVRLMQSNDFNLLLEALSEIQNLIKNQEELSLSILKVFQNKK